MAIMPQSAVDSTYRRRLGEDLADEYLDDALHSSIELPNAKRNRTVAAANYFRSSYATNANLLLSGDHELTFIVPCPPKSLWISSILPPFSGILRRMTF